MRTIKFRFWSIANKEMITSESINKEHAYRYLINKNDEISYIIPLQFTGLTDKNNKDIYEGDILENGWEISFKDGMFGVFNCNIHMSFNSYMSKHREVAGNIYENPELLTVPTAVL